VTCVPVERVPVAGRLAALSNPQTLGSDPSESASISNLLTPHIEGSYRQGERQRVLLELTPRQYSLLRRVSEGWTNQQIARRMGLAEGTVRTHPNNIYVRLGVGSRTQAVTRMFGLSRHAIPFPSR
jgi:DNA-binding NarL/FixJ family response regulator